LATFCALGGSDTVNNYTCTIQWRAPEVKGGHYVSASDVYSYGVVLWELITRDDPWKELDWTQVMKVVRKGQRPPILDSCPPQFKELIEQCWHGDPTKRPTFSQVITQLSELKEKNFEGLDSLLSLPTASGQDGFPVFWGRTWQTVFADPEKMAIGQKIAATSIPQLIRENKKCKGFFSLTDKWGKLFNLFIFETQEGLRNGDKILQGMQSTPIMQEFQSLFSLPVQQEVRETAYINIKPGASVALISKILIKKGSNEAAFALYAEKIIPSLFVLPGWSGTLVLADYNKGSVTLINLFSAASHIEEARALGWISRNISDFKEMLLSMPTVEEYTLHSGILDDIIIQ